MNKKKKEKGLTWIKKQIKTFFNRIQDNMNINRAKCIISEFRDKDKRWPLTVDGEDYKVTLGAIFASDDCYEFWVDKDPWIANYMFGFKLFKKSFQNMLIENNFYLDGVFNQLAPIEIRAQKRRVKEWAIEEEMNKLKEQEKRSKIREAAEKRVYGKIKTKRKTFDSDLKETVYSKYNSECAICGANEGLHIHHKDNDAKNNKISNLILLCGICHKKIHMNVR